MHNLKFRRQFFCTNQKIQTPDNWIKLEFQSPYDWYLFHHPDLKVYYGKSDRFSLVTIGYILDPYHPALNTQEILNALLLQKDLDAIIRETHKFTGRFAIIYFNEKNIDVFHDFTAFREVYYYFNKENFVFGSTPNLLAEFFGIKKTQNPEILSFWNSEALRMNDTTWVGFDTPFEGIRQLAPNHYLDIHTKEIKRYWPLNPLSKISLKDCTEESARILKGTIESAIKQFPLHVGLTAGWDTRLVLAATRDFKDQIFYYTNRRSNSPTRDVIIPQRISFTTGIRTNFIDIDEIVPDSFVELFMGNNILARKKLLPVFYEVYKRGWDDTVTLSGTSGNGLARIYLRIPKGSPINGTAIAKLSHYEKEPYAVSALDEWAKQVLPLCKSFNIDIMDLFQAEQDNSHWASLASSEQDIVREEIRIFNNRYLIEMFWSLDEKHRYQYDPDNYKAIIRLLWPELLKIPVNPSGKNKLYGILRAFGIERALYTMYKNFQFNRQ